MKIRTNNNPFDRKTTTHLRGLCALLVVCTHLSNYIYLGTMSVAIFFMLSGYGIFVSYLKERKSYCKKLFFKKVFKTYFIYVFFNILCFFIFYFGRTEDDLLRMSERIFALRFGSYNDFSWFFVSIIFLYTICSIVLFLNFSDKTKIIILDIFLIIIWLISNTICNYFVQINNRSILCFLIGINYAYFYKSVNNYIKENNVVFLLFSLTILILLYLFSCDYWIVNIALCVFVIIFCNQFDFSDKVGVFLGKISLYIYTCQMIPIYCFGNSTWYFTFLSFVGSIFIAILFYYIVNFFKKIKK